MKLMQPKSLFLGLIVVCLAPVYLTVSNIQAQEFTPLRYGDTATSVDLGVGLWAWPLPMDWDGDGDLDMVVSCPDKPYSGTYLFENKQSNSLPLVKMPVFEPPVRIGPGMKNVQISYVDGKPRVLRENREFEDFLGRELDTKRTRVVHAQSDVHDSKGNQRFNVWSYADYNGDGLQDVVVGVDDWGYYGWDDGFDSQGNWKRGPLHGLVYVLPNIGSESKPQYGKAETVKADGKPINVYGNPMPNFADFDSDGDLDLICGEFLDGLTYFENIGNRESPKYRKRGYLKSGSSRVAMHVQMITPTSIDWDRDGDVDLVVGDEDGRVALIENLGSVENDMPDFSMPKYFQQKAKDLKFGALVTPVSVDWDNDGDEDLVCGNTSGNIAWFENTGGKDPKWEPPELIYAGDRPIWIQAGPNGSIQGPAEAKWGYTTLNVADWDHDGDLDLVCNSIWGRVVWYENTGSRDKPVFAPEKSVQVHWDGAAPKPSWVWWTPESTELVTQWRTTPMIVDWNQDQHNDLVMLDHEGYLAFFERFEQDGKLWLKPGKRIFKGGWYDSRQRKKAANDDLLRLNVGQNGGSGRRKLCLVDWDLDGDLDLLVNSVNANWLRNDGTEDGFTKFVDMGEVSSHVLAGHTTSPTVCDWDKDGVPDLLLGAEDGRIYFLSNPHRP